MRYRPDEFVRNFVIPVEDAQLRHMGPPREGQNPLLARMSSPYESSQLRAFGIDVPGDWPETILLVPLYQRDDPSETVWRLVRRGIHLPVDDGSTAIVGYLTDDGEITEERP